MTHLVVGATGATGRLLVKQLLDRGDQVRVVIRPESALPEDIANHDNLSVTRANLLDMSDAELTEVVQGCDAVASCLGHTLSFKGIFGKPRRLVTDAVRRLCAAIIANQPATPVRYVLMNTAGNSNRDLDEPISFSQACVIGLLRLLLPPHVDNENAADYLRTQIGQDDPHIQWSAVRPDTLIDHDTVTEYTAHPSPTRSAIFDPGKTSRINVAHFMADLMTGDEKWGGWRGQMPVIYNA